MAEQLFNFMLKNVYFYERLYIKYLKFTGEWAKWLSDKFMSKPSLHIYKFLSDSYSFKLTN